MHLAHEPTILPYGLDDELLDLVRRDGEARLKVYRLARPTVVLGRGSKADVELNLEACASEGVQIRRRRGGGCAVVIDPGNVIVSCVVPAAGIGDNSRHMRRLAAWLIEALERLGVEGLGRAGVSDLVQEGRKVSGSCIYRPRGLLYFSASLLVDAELARIERYLRHPPREPEYRQARRHGEFVGCLRTPEGLETAQALEPALRSVLAPPPPV